MSDNGLEMDEVDVVDVTGKIYKDKKKNKKKNTCHLSLRDTTLLIFLGLLVLYVLGIGTQNIVMSNSFVELEESECRRSVNRVAVAISTDVSSLRELAQQYAFWDEAVELTKHHENVDDFVIDNFLDEDQETINTDLRINYIAFVDKDDFSAWWSGYYPPPADNSAQVDGPRSEITPIIDPKILREAAERLEDPSEGWNLIITPKGVKDLFLVAAEPIMTSVDPNDTSVYGYFLVGRNVAPHVQSFSNDVPTCITFECKDSDSQYWDKEDKAAFEESVPGTFNDDSTFGGTPAYRQRPFEYLNKSENRICPEEGINETSNMMTGYFVLCDFDPEESDYSTCVRIRLDNPMALKEQGVQPVAILSVAIMVLMVVLCIIFVVFLDCVVLRPIVNLSKVLEKQAQWQEEECEEEIVVVQQARKGKAAHGDSEFSGTATTTSGDGDGEKKGGTDEIGKLRRAMEQNATGLKNRLKAVDHELKLEQQKTARHRQAMQLLNLWRGHKTYFPGLRPNAMELRYEPPRKLDDLLNNPLAIEFLKSHCETDRSLENLWFLLDVSWVEELEKAREHEESADKRSQIHDVAVSAANAIISRYIAANAPQQINISSATCKKLREKEGSYERGMFSAAVSEVKMLLGMDVLPRFQKSSAYAAMSEALFSIAPTNTESDNSDISSEDSASTAGSILTDDIEDEAGVARVYAQTFRTLHNNFAASSDASMASLHSFEGNQAIHGVLHLEPRKKKADSKQSPGEGSFSNPGPAGGSQDLSESSEMSESSDSTDSSVSEKSEKEKPKKEEPKAEEPAKEEPKAEEPAKEEPKAEEPAKEEPKAEEPAKEEPKAEEPAKEEPKAEEPAKKEEPAKEEAKKESADSSDSSEASALSSDSVTMSSASSDDE